MENYDRWRKADLISKLHGYEAERSVETQAMLLVMGLPELDPEGQTKAELLLSLARRIDSTKTASNAVPGLAKEFVALLEGLGAKRSKGDSFDEELRNA